MTEPAIPAPRPERTWLRTAEDRVHNAALRALGLTPDHRAKVVEEMFLRRRRDAAGYWLQLILAMGIATLGLALGSTAVVIGAMLIAPLMGPIVELGMGLTLGSPVMTIRAFGRASASIVAVIAGAAFLTLLLPFQEINPEIASRTSPTALDLFIAIFVALAAALTTVRSSSDTTSAAAGTAIGIALVPPLCVIGFGIGIRDADVAGGATLLFVTNLTAILLVAVLSFLVVGFETVETRRWEEAALARTPPGSFTYWVVGTLSRVFGSRYSRVLRIATPMLLVAAVIVPLSRALDQVAWEVRARAAVARVMDGATASGSVVQSNVAVERGAVAVRMYLVGSYENASALERRMTTSIAAATGVEPTVRVIAVPDVQSLQALRQLASDRDGEAAARPRALELADLRARVGSAVQGAWPGEALGAVTGWSLELPDSATARVVVRYLGEPAGEAAQLLLARALSDRLSTPVAVRLEALSSGAVAAPTAEGAAWLPTLVRALGVVQSDAGVNACVTLPDPGELNASGTRLANAVRAEAAALPPSRVAVQDGGEGWAVRLARGPCVVAPDSVAPAAESAAAAPAGE